MGLQNVSIEDVMIHEVKTLHASNTIGEAVKAFAAHRVGGFPVVDDALRVVGYVSDGDIIHYIMHRAGTHGVTVLKSWSDTDVAALERAARAVAGEAVMNCATRDVRTVHADEMVVEVAKVMNKRRLKHLPVVREGRLVGLISRNALIRCFFADYTKVAKN